MRKLNRFVPPVLAFSALLSLAGCSSNFALPWEDNMLDPSRVATREPLEIPPDLNVLPGQEPREEEENRMVTPGTDGSAPASARSILFKTPENRQESKPLTRDQQERLPGWIGNSPGGR
ncbi:MAG: hypothetical protein HQL99_04680 [Magnetococcales bacterium]|nr:hypothetical protein [Magnetococcales bacterium]